MLLIDADGEVDIPLMDGDGLISRDALLPLVEGVGMFMFIGEAVDADVVAHADRRVRYVGVNLGGHVAHEAAVVLRPDHVLEALGIVAEHPARGLVVPDRAHDHLVDGEAPGVLEQVVPPTSPNVSWDPQSLKFCLNLFVFSAVTLAVYAAYRAFWFG